MDGKKMAIDLFVFLADCLLLSERCKYNSWRYPKKENLFQEERIMAYVMLLPDKNTTFFNYPMFFSG
jgi:hypothetical protein